jgi:hypothetical protein
VYPVDGGAGSFGSPEVFEPLTDDEAREDLIVDLSFDSDEAYGVISHHRTDRHDTPHHHGTAPPPRRYRRVIAVDGKTLDRLLVLAPTMATATRLSPTAESTSRHRATGH